MPAKSIRVLAALTQSALDSDGAAVESSWETVGEAKRRARYYTSTAYARMAELSEPLGYARVVVDGECVFDVTIETHGGHG